MYLLYISIKCVTYRVCRVFMNFFKPAEMYILVSHDKLKIKVKLQPILLTFSSFVETIEDATLRSLYITDLLRK